MVDVRTKTYCAMLTTGVCDLPARIAALEAQLAERVKVKKLGWEELTSPREDGPAELTGDLEATTMIGEYSVCFDSDEEVADTPWCCWGPIENIGHFADMDAAKAAAQADFERRTLSVLEATPPAPKVTDEMVERACRVHNVGWSLWKEPQKKTAREVMRAALTAAQEAGK